MKKSRIRPFVWVLLIAISLASYTYLYLVSVQESENGSSYVVKQEDNLQNDPKVLFLDIAVVKKILNLTKVLLPQS